MKNKDTQCRKKTSIGGQALLEGIMMRGPKMTAMAVRNTDGEIVIEKFPTESVARGKFFKLPIIRGLFGYVDSMKFGSKCLMRSAEIAGLDEAEAELEEEKRQKRLEKAQKNPKMAEKLAKKQAKEDKKKEDRIAKATAKYNEAEAARAALAVKLEEKKASLDAAVENRADATEIKKIKTEIEVFEKEVAKATAKADEAKKNMKNPSSSALTAGVTVIGTVLGMVLAIALFILLPTYLYQLASAHIGFLTTDNPTVNSLIKSVFEGVLKVLILVGYMGAVSLMKDIRRTFMFHGAEQMTIFCYEAGLELTVENVRKQKRFHPRCGTSFLILMVLVSIFVSFFIDPLLSLVGITEAFKFYMLIRAGLKILTLPLIVGLGYELIKIAGRYDNFITKIISLPGVWLQHITVFKPTDDMIECAIAAVKEVIPDDDSDRW